MKSRRLQHLLVLLWTVGFCFFATSMDSQSATMRSPTSNASCVAPCDASRRV